MKKLCKNAYLLYNILSTFENILKFLLQFVWHLTYSKKRMKLCYVVIT